MKKCYIFFFLIGLMSFILNVQVICDELGVLLMDDLLAYVIGDIIFQLDDWDIWLGVIVGVEVFVE